MGTVWRAEDIRLGRQVALKVVGKELAADSQAMDRIESEPRLASSIAPPNIVSVYDVGSIDEGRFFAMELVDGDDLDTLLHIRRLRIPEIVEWALQIGDALVAAHRVGIVHRDIKPANIYIARNGGYAQPRGVGISKPRGHPPH